MSSPIVNQMDFYEAIKEIMSGHKITRLEWGNSQYYCLFRQTKLQLRKDDGKYYDWIINEGDLLADDWIVVRDN